MCNEDHEPLGMIQIRLPWKLSSFQDPPHPPCLSTSKILLSSWTRTYNFKRNPTLQIITNQLKENIMTICIANQWTSFYVIGNFVMKELMAKISKVHTGSPISCPWFHSMPPENIRKPLIFCCFQRAEAWLLEEKQSLKLLLTCYWYTNFREIFSYIPQLYQRKK